MSLLHLIKWEQTSIYFTFQFTSKEEKNKNVI